VESTIINDDIINVDLSPYSKKISLVYIDPPFRTQTVQKGEAGSYNDKWEKRQDYLDFLLERILLAWDVCLADNGSLLIHIDRREVHYIKVMLDEHLGEDKFMNEIIWSYDYGGRSKKKWSNKHDNILWYAKNPKNYIFNYNDIDRIPYMAPGLVGKEKAAAGKVPTDSWFITIEPTMSKQRTGYPTQKPTKLLDRLIKAHSNPGDFVMDFFCGSGTTGYSAHKNGRGYILIDKNIEAYNISRQRLSSA